MVLFKNSDASFQIGAAGNVNCGVLTCGNVTCPDVEYNSGANSLITSLSTINTLINNHTTTISNLAPIVSSNALRVGSLTSETGVTCALMTVNGGAVIAGDITYTLLRTSLTTQMSSKANLASLSFTGT